MKRSTCLKWGPASDRLPDLIAFRDRVTRCLDTARAKQATNRFYKAMLPDLERELISVTNRIVTARQVGGRQRRQKAA